MLEAALPSQPVLITGWNEVPHGGSPFVGCDTRTQAEAKAQELAAAEGVLCALESAHAVAGSKDRKSVV